MEKYCDGVEKNRLSGACACDDYGNVLEYSGRSVM